MAIKNASDLLVYTKTSAAVKQVTRIRALTTAPFSVFETDKKGIKINNITKTDGTIIDNAAKNITSNTGSSIIANVGSELVSSYNYVDISGSNQTDGDYTYRDYQNGATGLVPTLQIVSGTATLKENGVTIEIVTPGSSAILDPVGFSTQASFSTNMDLRDVTTKDSLGHSESLDGLRSFEVSTELLQNVNPDVPIDGTDFFNKLKLRTPVNVSFSDRMKNLLVTNLTTIGVDNFTASGLTQVVGQSDPFGGTTASKITTGASTSSKYLRYTIAAARVEDNKVTWSFYVKGSGSTNKASFTPSNNPTDPVVTKLSGPGSVAIVSGNYVISNLTTSDWTRLEVSIDTLGMTGNSGLEFYLYPGLFTAQDSDVILTSSWQIELKGKASDYQDHTTITRWQGDAFVTSVNFDAGVEDNLTCSATFTGTATVTLNS